MKQGFWIIISLCLMMSACAIQSEPEEEANEEQRLNVNESEWITMSPADKAEAIGGYN